MQPVECNAVEPKGQKTSVYICVSGLYRTHYWLRCNCLAGLRALSFQDPGAALFTALVQNHDIPCLRMGTSRAGSSLIHVRAVAAHGYPGVEAGIAELDIATFSHLN